MPVPPKLSVPQSPPTTFRCLDCLGITHSTMKHPPLFTVEQARGCTARFAGGHTKNLFLRDKKWALFLVVALEDAVIDLKGLHRLLGACGRFSSGRPTSCAKFWAWSPVGHPLRRHQ